MNVFSQEAKQQVLETLFNLATENKSTSVAAIKLYLELADEQSPHDALTVDRALEILRQALPQDKPQSDQDFPLTPENQEEEI